MSEHKTHYIRMNGSIGCIPDSIDVYQTKKEAVDGLCDIFDNFDEWGLPPNFRKELTSNGLYYFDFYVHLTKSGPRTCDRWANGGENVHSSASVWGAQYAEVAECNCDSPWEHTEHVPGHILEAINKYNSFLNGELDDLNPDIADELTEALHEIITKHFWED